MRSLSDITDEREKASMDERSDTGLLYWPLRHELFGRFSAARYSALAG
jgi:hypothetical protein